MRGSGDEPCESELDEGESGRTSTQNVSSDHPRRYEFVSGSIPLP